MEMRQAGIGDLPKLEATARAFYASSRFLGDFEMERFIALWTRLLADETGVIFAFADGAEVVGALGGVVYPDAYSPRMIAVEFFWFVRPERRGKGLQLYYAFEEWAKRKGARQIRMTHLCDLMPENLRWLYGELGFTAIEINYAKELPWPSEPQQPSS